MGLAYCLNSEVMGIYSKKMDIRLMISPALWLVFKAAKYQQYMWQVNSRGTLL